MKTVLLFILLFVSTTTIVYASENEKIFNFENSKDFSGWPELAKKMKVIVKDGALIMNVDSNDEGGGMFFHSPVLRNSFKASDYPILEIKAKSDKPYKLDFYWLEDGDNSWVSRERIIQMNGDGKYHVYKIDLTDPAKWKNNIIQLRLGVITFRTTPPVKVEKGDKVYIDYIKFTPRFKKKVELINLWEQNKIVLLLPDFELRKKVQSVEIINKKGEIVFQTKNLGSGSMKNSIKLSTENIKPGKYVVDINYMDPSGKKHSIKRPFEKLKKPLWLKTAEERKIKEVLPPWTPLQTENKQISCWGRTYKFGNLPFPKQITSGNKEMLSSPITIRGTISGEKIKWGRKGDFKFTEKKDYVVSYSTKTKGNLVDIESKCYVEFDGMIWFDFSILPHDQNAKFKNLYIEIPFKKKNSLYYWFGGTTWENYRANSFKSKDIKFDPYIAISDNNVGLCWFVETVQNWHFKKKEFASLISGKNENILKINLINIPHRYGKNKIKFSFGLQATPIRPLSKDPHKHPGNMSVLDPHSAVGYLGIDKDLMQRYNIKSIIYCFFSDLLTTGFIPSSKKKENELKQSLKGWNEKNIAIMPYSNLSNASAQDEVFKKYGDEWIIMRYGKWEPRPRVGLFPYPTLYSTCSGSGSWQDYFISSLEKSIKNYGTKGVYLDCSNAYPCQNLTHKHGYLDSEGNTKSIIPIRGNREFFKRIYALKNKYKNFDIAFHMSTQPCIPSASFADYMIDGESLLLKPKVFELSLKAFRAQYMGSKWGIPVNLWVHTLNPNKGYLNNEKALAFSILHPGTDFTMEASMLFYERINRIYDTMKKFNVVDAKLYPYWSNQDLIQINSKNVKANLYRKENGQLLIVLSNLRKKKENITVSLNEKSLRGSGDKYARNYVNGEMHKVKKGKFNIVLDTQNRVKIYHIGKKNELIYNISPQPNGVNEFFGYDSNVSNFPKMWQNLTPVKQFIAKEQKYAPKQTEKIKFKYPFDKTYKRLYLGIETRLNAVSPTGGGCAHGLRLSVNGNIIGPNNTISKNLESCLNTGMKFKWFNDGAWILFAYPDYTVPTNRADLYYRPLKENPFTYVFDITDLLVKGENIIEVKSDFEVYIKTLAVKGK